jgi:hypothetical protein
MANYAAEFTKLFTGAGCSVEGKDWNAPKYFDGQNNDCYKAETALISELTSEAYSNFGFEVQYYVRDMNTKKDILFGEDNIPNVVRRFILKMYTDSIPQMQKSYNLQGMIYTELITCQCTIQHFYDASQLSYPDLQDIYEPIEPRIGDIVYIEYSDTFYEIVNVKEFAENTSFLSVPTTYTFILRVWHNNTDNVDEENVNPDQMEELRHYEELGETFNLDLTNDEKNIPTSTVGPEKDMLQTNTDAKKDTDEGELPKKNPSIVEPTDNVKTHEEFVPNETKVENPQYYDPFEGW